jgi:hypothetical protein
MQGIEFYQAMLNKRDGTQGLSIVGIGPDRSLWVEPSFLGISDREVARLQKDFGAQVLRLPNGVHVFIEASGIVASCKTEEREKELARMVDDFLEYFHPSNFRE